jgi:hypothetical protein
MLEAALAILILSMIAGAGSSLVRELWKRTRCDHLQFRRAIREASARVLPPSGTCPEEERPLRLRPLNEIEIEEFQ